VLSRRVGIESASSTANLESLEKRGYVRRVRDSRDRRSVNVSLTAAGKKVKGKLLACAKTTNLLARQGMSRNDILMVFSLLQRIVDNLERTEPRSVRDSRGANVRRAKPSFRMTPALVRNRDSYTGS